MRGRCCRQSDKVEIVAAIIQSLGRTKQYELQEPILARDTDIYAADNDMEAGDDICELTLSTHSKTKTVKTILT
jgi:hypothetical protein